MQTQTPKSPNPNFVTGLARLEREFDLRYTPGGIEVASARVEFVISSMSERYGSLTVWTPSDWADIALVPVGTALLFKGTKKTDEWTSPRGERKSGVDVNVWALAWPVTIPEQRFANGESRIAWKEKPRRQAVPNRPPVTDVDPDKIPF